MNSHCSPGLECRHAPRAATAIRSLCTAAIVGTTATAQCGTSWLPGDPLADANARVSVARRWDPDGSGPLPEQVVLGGRFSAIGNVATRGLATYDPAVRQFATLGGGFSGAFAGDVHVRAIVAMPNGDLVAAGQFLAAGGTTAYNIARWNGSSWSPLGAGLGGVVSGLVLLQNGDLIAAGDFQWSGGTVLNRVARWDGTSWSPLGAGLDNVVQTIVQLPNGNLVAGGFFTTSGGQPANRVAAWNGATWTTLGGGVDREVEALLVMPNGDLWVGGAFLAAGGLGAAGIARWDGAAWSAPAGGVIGTVHSLARAANGDVLAGGTFRFAGGGACNHVGRWNGTSWSQIGAGIGTLSWHSVHTLLELPTGTLIAGGLFVEPNGLDNLARFDGGVWDELRPGTDGQVRALARLPNGDLIVGGQFRSIGGTVARNIARWNGSWLPLGQGLDGTVVALLPLPNGDLIAGGQFTSAGAVAASGVGRWSGGAWAPLGTGLPPLVRALAHGPNGTIAAAGEFPERVSLWNGATWVGTGLPTPPPGYLAIYAPTALQTLPNGELLASGLGLTSAQSSWFARFDGTNWTSLPGGAGPARRIVNLANGDIVAASATGVQRWNGISWSTVVTSSGPVDAVAELPDGDLVFGGDFTAIRGTAARRLARWDGSNVTPLGAGANGPVAALLMADTGELTIGGAFTTVDDALAPAVARLVSTCPATAVDYGQPCAGPTGAPNLTAIQRPWLGGTFRARVAGLPSIGLGIEVIGLAATAVPLPTLLPQGVAGCALLANPDLLEARAWSGGALDLAVAIPPVPALAQLQFHQQVLVLEGLLGGPLTAVFGTDALTATIGQF